jgi:hypothetical protein
LERVGEDRYVPYRLYSRRHAHAKMLNTRPRQRLEIYLYEVTLLLGIFVKVIQRLE